MFEEVHPLENSNVSYLDIVYVAFTSDAFAERVVASPVCTPYSALSYSFLVKKTCF